jgi:hypothetical protein
MLVNLAAQSARAAPAVTCMVMNLRISLSKNARMQQVAPNAILIQYGYLGVVLVEQSL